MKRRTFLKLAGAAAAAPFIIPSRVLGQNAPSNRLNVGAIGAWNQWNGHRDYVLGDPRLQLTWICDVDAEHVKFNVDKIEQRYAKDKASGSFKGVKTSDDYRELLVDKDVDIVWVCTPDHWHALASTGVAQAGKHLYVEKPLARTEAEGRSIVNAVQRAGVVAQVGCQQRSGWEFQRMIALTRNGALGKIRSVTVGLPGGGGDRGIKEIKEEPIPEGFNWQMWLGPAPDVPYSRKRTHWDWRWNYSYGGGNLTDWINHHYDIAQLAVGVNEEAPVAIRNAWAEFDDCPIYNTAVKYAFEVHYAGGKVIHVGSDYRGGITIVGENGTIWANRGEFEGSDPAFRNMELPSDGYVLPGGDITVSDHRRNFINAIFDRITPRAPVRQAYYTALAAHLANAAFRAGVSDLKWDTVAGNTDSSEANRYMAANYRGPWTLPNV
ncbi:MAG: Gfo/Idh/MocA family oxidoreductase [Verrucomicrobiales bacterium]|jgi:predicted dehydrogenase|nr:Gfo/Idh/MocA family oxidoreductase [Verrucomicrobiales bacterium]